MVKWNSEDYDPLNPLKILSLGKFLGLCLPISFLVPLLCPATQERTFPEIKITHGDWGTASKHEVHKVLSSTARSLPKEVEFSSSTILVGRSENGPIVLYNRGNNDEFTIKLNTRNRFWSQYAFQFAHEIGHIICGFKKGHEGNLWFEESVCEVFSLCALQSLAKKWKDSPPYQNWKNYAEEFKKYSLNRIENNSFAEQSQFLVWFKENKNFLNEFPTDRSKNCRVASVLLPIFKSNSFSWSACKYLNKGKNFEEKSFGRYLEDWMENCPLEGQKQFVERIRELFGIQFPKQ